MLGAFATVIRFIIFMRFLSNVWISKKRLLNPEWKFININCSNKLLKHNIEHSRELSYGDAISLFGFKF